MAPNNDGDCDREMSALMTHIPSSTHKHRRGKTGKTRKRGRNWSLFSRWKTSESEDDDDFELYRWSKSRGLTSRTLPAAPSAAQQDDSLQKTSRMRYNDHADSKINSTQRPSAHFAKEKAKRVASAHTIASLQEAIFLTKLCPSINDKRSFVELSKKQAPVEKTREHNIASPLTKVQNSEEQKRQESGVAKLKRVSSQSSQPNSPLPQQTTAVSKPTSEIKAPDSKVAEARTGRNNESTLTKGSTIDNQHSPSPQVTVSRATTPPTMQLLKKEWSANVENEILQLYESTSTAQSNAHLIYRWAAPSQSFAAAPTQQNPIPQTIEQRIEQADHTPSYVQMLAKMFKNRMQMRKEREERVEENLRRTKLTLDCVGNSSASTKSDSALSKPQFCPALHPQPPLSKAHLRYRHVAEKRPGRSDDEGRNQVEIAHTIRIDQLEVGYTHGRYSQALNFNPDNSFGKLSANYSKSGGIPKADNVYVKHADGQCANEDVSTQLQKPTPYLHPLRHTTKQDSRSTLVIARKAQQCLAPPSNVKATEKHKTTVPHESVGYSNLPVRWSTSVGTLYCKPPVGRILNKPPAQKV